MTDHPDGPSRDDEDPGPVDQAIRLIRQRGGRSTTPRRVLLEALMAAEGELSTAEDLLARIQADYPDFTQSTVYRTLALLESLGLVDHVHLGHGPSHWHVADSRRHWYLTCTTCGQVTAADPDPFEVLAAEIADQTGFRLESGHFAVTGTCARCAAKKSSRPASRP